MYVLPDIMLKDIILALEASTSLFPAGWKLHLYTNNITPTRSSTVATFTELTSGEVPGYAAATPTWNGTPRRNQNLSWSDFGTAEQFLATGAPSAPQVVYGWFATDSGSANLIGAGLLAQPFTFTAAGDGFTLQPVMNVSQTDSTNSDLMLDMLQE